MSVHLETPSTSCIALLSLTPHRKVAIIVTKLSVVVQVDLPVVFSILIFDAHHCARPMRLMQTPAHI